MAEDLRFITDEGRPLPGPPVVGVTGETAILRELLAVERERLRVARRIEGERDFIFPETTVIVRDIERLLGKVRAQERGEQNPIESTDLLADLLRDVAS